MLVRNMQNPNINTALGLMSADFLGEREAALYQSLCEDCVLPCCCSVALPTSNGFLAAGATRALLE